MVILEKPFVSAMMVETLEKNGIPVLRNSISEQRVTNCKVLSDSEFCDEYKKTGKLYKRMRARAQSSSGRAVSLRLQNRTS